MRTRRAIHAAALAAALAAVLAVVLTSGHRGSAASATGMGGLREVGPMPKGAEVSFALELRIRDPRRLQASLAAIEDPRSAAFGHFIGPEAFGKSFGIRAATLAALEQTVRSEGFRVTETYPQRTELALEGQAAAVERAFDTKLALYADRAGHLYHTPLSAPRIPAAIAGAAEAVIGLDTRPRLRPHEVPIGGLTPALVDAAYDVTRLQKAGFLGQGQTIAVISYAAFDPGDPTSFARQYGLTSPAPQVVPVAGGTTDTSDEAETNLDIDVIRSVAPQARILVYESYGASDAAMIDRIVSDRQSQIVSTSWGQCERGMGGADRLADTRALKAAAAAGVTVFASTGDFGAYDCQDGNLPDHHLSVDWPAASANAVAVGGSRLYTAPDGAYLSETAWEDQLSPGGGGGGFAINDARPGWQKAPGVPGPFSTGRRQLPDVSADADPGTPWSYYSGGRLQANGGTSASTPFWAAAMALITQYAARRGIHRIPYLNPILYALASRRQRYRPFHDITTGGNRYYQAGPGWDPATGLGSPDVYNLARDIVAFLKSRRGGRR